MTARALRPGTFVSAVLVLAGLAIVIAPSQALNIGQLALVAIATGAALHLLVRTVPQAGWVSPFRWMSPFGAPPRSVRRVHGTDEIQIIRSLMAGRRQRIGPGVALPPSILRALRPLIASSLDVDPDMLDTEEVRSRVSSLTWAVLRSEPLSRVTWVGTTRPDVGAVADLVHRILDDLGGAPPATVRPAAVRLDLSSNPTP